MKKKAFVRQNTLIHATCIIKYYAKSSALLVFIEYGWKLENEITKKKNSRIDWIYNIYGNCIAMYK